MLLKHRVDAQLLAARHAQQAITRLVRPVQAQRRGVGDEEVVKVDLRVHLHHFVAHVRPGEMIDPGRVRREQLAGARRHPVRQAVVGFLGEGDFPAHDEEHDVEDGDLLGQGAEVGEGAKDVGEDFAERVGVDAAFRIEKGGDGGVGGANEFLRRDAFGGASLLFREKIEEEAIKGAGGADIANRNCTSKHRNFKIGGTLAVGDWGFGGGLRGKKRVF